MTKQQSEFNEASLTETVLTELKSRGVPGYFNLLL